MKDRTNLSVSSAECRPSLSLCFLGPVLLLFPYLLTKVFNCSPSLQLALPPGGVGGKRDPAEEWGRDWEKKGFNSFFFFFFMCFISPSHHNLIFFEQKLLQPSA